MESAVEFVLVPAFARGVEPLRRARRSSQPCVPIDDAGDDAGDDASEPESAGEEGARESSPPSSVLGGRRRAEKSARACFSQLGLARRACYSSHSDFRSPNTRTLTVLPLLATTLSALESAAPATTDWLAASVPWVLMGCFLALLVIASCAVLLLRKVERLDGRTARLDVLEDVVASVRKIADEHGNLDLRRVEHALLDIRDGQKRTEDRLLNVVEAARVERPAREAPADASDAGTRLAERIYQRLIALGYEHVHLVMSRDEIAALAEGDSPPDGEVLVEARRSGAPCKGRVLIRGGVLTDVELQSIYSIFP